MQPFTMTFKKHSPAEGFPAESRALLWPLMAAVILATTPLMISAQTKVWGVITRDVKWTLDESPYLIIGDIDVKPRARLTIMPGVTVFCAPVTIKDGSIAQFDHLDSFKVAVKIEGSLECAGTKVKRIVFALDPKGPAGSSWYGIILNKASDQYTDLAFTDISGACNAITAVGCSPLVRRCIIERNNVGVFCGPGGNARVYNCVITGNYATGVKTQNANPVFFNNIVAFNRNNGLWCDGVSRVTFQYNCVWGNGDGDFLECDPELGAAVRAGKKDKTPKDASDNVLANPIFAGSPDDSLAVEKDLAVPTDKSRMADTSLAKVLYKSLADSMAAKKRTAVYPRFSLSKYSPCIDAGNPAGQFKDLDGTRNDMGIYGGPEFLGKGK